jgi:hypothetical protein
LTPPKDFPLADIVQSILPLGATSNVPDYPYFTGGTCFLARRRGRLFVVTAAHALDDKPAENVWVPRHIDTLERLPLRQVVYTSPLSAEYERAADIAAFEVDEMSVVGRLAPAIEFDASVFWNPDDAKPGTEVIFAGFPKLGLDNAVDYEARRISRQRFIGGGRYAESSGRWIHRVTIEQWGPVETLDGMSGSPVFMRLGPGALSFAGVLVRGDANADVAHFVEARVPFWLLDGTVRRDKNAAKRQRRARRGG